MKRKLSTTPMKYPPQRPHTLFFLGPKKGHVRGGHLPPFYESLLSWRFVFCTKKPQNSWFFGSHLSNKVFFFGQRKLCFKKVQNPFEKGHSKKISDLHPGLSIKTSLIFERGEGTLVSPEETLTKKIHTENYFA